MNRSKRLVGIVSLGDRRPLLYSPDAVGLALSGVVAGMDGEPEMH